MVQLLKVLGIDWTVVPQIINFIILIIALNFVAYKPIRKILLERKAKMDGLAESAESAGIQAEEKNAAFSSGLKDARTQGKNEKDALLQAADDEEKAIVGRINDTAREDMAAIKVRIAKDADAVKAALEKEVDAFSDAIAQKILGRAA